jgi:hypothetical protein
MSVVSVKVDVYCDHVQTGEPVYRVYVDGDLLTERTWIWPTYEVYIRENIEVEVGTGSHLLRIENVYNNANFACKNLTVNGQVVAPEPLGLDLAFVV